MEWFLVNICTSEYTDLMVSSFPPVFRWSCSLGRAYGCMSHRECSLCPVRLLPMQRGSRESSYDTGVRERSVNGVFVDKAYHFHGIYIKVFNKSITFTCIFECSHDVKKLRCLFLFLYLFFDEWTMYVVRGKITCFFIAFYYKVV